MCELAVADSPWITLSKWEALQSNFASYPTVTKHHSEYITSAFPDKDILVMFLCGADHAIKVFPSFIKSM